MITNVATEYTLALHHQRAAEMQAAAERYRLARSLAPRRGPAAAHRRRRLRRRARAGTPVLP